MPVFGELFYGQFHISAEFVGLPEKFQLFGFYGRIYRILLRRNLDPVYIGLNAPKTYSNFLIPACGIVRLVERQDLIFFLCR